MSYLDDFGILLEKEKSNVAELEGDAEDKKKRADTAIRESDIANSELAQAKRSVKNLSALYDKQIAGISDVKSKHIKEDPIIPIDESDPSILNLEELVPVEKNTRKRTLKDLTMDAIKRFNKSEFENKHVFGYFKKIGKVPKNEKQFKNKLSTIVKELAVDGFLERTHEGKGSAPHRYREKKVNVSFTQ